MTSSRRAGRVALAAVAALSIQLAAAPLFALTPADLAFRQAVAESAAEEEAVAGFYREHGYATLWTSGADAARRAALFAALDGAGG
ncbi:MAG: murein L,D-transpeptidase, partial [Albidovulum sp.]